MTLRTQAAQVAWLNTRLTLDFIASSRTWIDDDLISALLVAGVVSANTSGADQGRGAPETFLGPGVLPDALRRPVNAMSVALSLGVPRESARSKLAALVEKGVLAKTAEGFILSAEVVVSEPFRAAMEIFVRAVADFIIGLSALQACGVRDGDRMASPAWSVAGVATRIVTTHVHRGIDHARSITPQTSLTTHYIMLSISHLTGSALRVAEKMPEDGGALDRFKPSIGPVSVAEVAAFTGLDDETVRRHIGQLEGNGSLMRVGSKRDVNLGNEAMVARWRDFQSRTMISTHQLARKLYLAGVIVDAPGEALTIL